MEDGEQVKSLDGRIAEPAQKPQVNNVFGESAENSGIISADRAEGTSHGSGKPSANVFPGDDTFEPYVKSLEDIGFVDARTPETVYALNHIPYSHLAYYFRLTLSEANPLEPSVKTVHDLVVFDRRFQATLMKYIGIVETQMRAQYSHWMRDAFGDFPHYNETLFTDTGNYSKTRASFEAEAGKAKMSNAVIRDMAKSNGGRIPIGYAVQVMSLGVLSRFYANTADVGVTKRVAESFGCTWGDLSGWFRAIADVRNICSHFGAYLSRKQMPTTPRKIKGLDAPNNKTPYIACIIAYLLGEGIGFSDKNLHYAHRLGQDMKPVVSQFEQLYPGISKEIGFENDWLRQLEVAASLGASERRRIRKRQLATQTSNEKDPAEEAE